MHYDRGVQEFSKKQIYLILKLLSESDSIRLDSTGLLDLISVLKPKKHKANKINYTCKFHLLEGGQTIILHQQHMNIEKMNTSTSEQFFFSDEMLNK
jgi:hypothetical protein